MGTYYLHYNNMGRNGLQIFVVFAFIFIFLAMAECINDNLFCFFVLFSRIGNLWT